MNSSKKIVLSNRQKQCIEHLLKGQTAREIANQLNLSHRTIEHYIELLKIKFDCRNKVQLVCRIIQQYGIS